MVRAYILIETMPDKVQEVESSVSQGLSNCKALAHNMIANEVVAHLHCNSLDDLNRGVIDIAKKDGVKQISTFLLKTD